jgi:hypothetical protein
MRLVATSSRNVSLTIAIAANIVGAPEASLDIPGKGELGESRALG